MKVTDAFFALKNPRSCSVTKASSPEAYWGKSFLIHRNSNTRGYRESHKSMKNEALGNCYLRDLKKIKMPNSF